MSSRHQIFNHFWWPESNILAYHEMKCGTVPRLQGNESIENLKKMQKYSAGFVTEFLGLKTSTKQFAFAES